MLRFIISCCIWLCIVNSYAQKNDFSIRLLNHEKDVYIEHDTMNFEFEITNHGPKEYKKGDKIYTASVIGGITFALDLIGPGPTPLVLKSDLKVGESFVYDAGYLLASLSSAYLGVTELDFCVVVYGDADSEADLTFPSDANPEDNIYCGRYSENPPNAVWAEVNNQSVEIFPNPATDKATLTLPEWSGVTLLLFDANGHLLNQQELRGEQTDIDLSITNGSLVMYQLIREDAYQTVQGRIIIQ